MFIQSDDTVYVLEFDFDDITQLLIYYSIPGYRFTLLDANDNGIYDTIVTSQENSIYTAGGFSYKVYYYYYHETTISTLYTETYYDELSDTTTRTYGQITNLESKPLGFGKLSLLLTVSGNGTMQYFMDYIDDPLVYLVFNGDKWEQYSEPIGSTYLSNAQVGKGWFRGEPVYVIYVGYHLFMYSIGNGLIQAYEVPLPQTQARLLVVGENSFGSDSLFLIIDDATQTIYSPNPIRFYIRPPVQSENTQDNSQTNENIGINANHAKQASSSTPQLPNTNMNKYVLSIIATGIIGIPVLLSQVKKRKK